MLRSKVMMSHLCLRLRWTRGGSSDGVLKMALKMGTYFLKMTADTVKFLSSLSVLWRKSWVRLAMSCHFFILLKNSMRLQEDDRDRFTAPMRFIYETGLWGGGPHHHHYSIILKLKHLCTFSYRLHDLTQAERILQQRQLKELLFKYEYSRASTKDITIDSYADYFLK